MKISLSPSHYEMCYTRYLNAKKTTGSPEVSTAEGLEVDNGEVGIGGSGGELPHCWIRLDHPRCGSLERWGSTTMRLLAVGVMVVRRKQSKLDNQDRISWIRKLGRLRWGSISLWRLGHYNKASEAISKL